ncbi:probable disease resistance protein At4g27220 [Vigna radiata var. radiata]|uniref:Probable disease resistance protein At4g27220 n=1 Tax=Vigna radiata var. radiata TaxID=3916 RepID=A0A3Q0F5K5_VIGRR|nr:probable disease resistance protein At4g27220 [Vigna radiata var. radiata]
MEDFFLSIATKIAEYAVHPILHHAQYLCCFNKFASNLPNAKEQLELTRDEVKERIREAINRVEKVEPTVEKWLKDVEKVLEEVQMLEERILSLNKYYFRRQCQYSLAKQIERKTSEMIQLHRNNKFEPFSKITELPGMQYYSSKDFFMFNSTEASYKKLLEALNNKSAFIIGLVGLGGSGKTTLAKEVGKKAEDMKLFEKVVWATVSQPLNIRSIQDQIVDQLGFKLTEDSDIGRARRLSERLKKGTTLIIMDDIWEILNFETLGIPLNESSKACCILITTRSKEVCTSMQCQSIIELNLLSDEEAWTLFRHYTNITDDSSEALKGVARKIVNECKGLPIAIVTVGSTLKDKTIANFELALSRLENSKPLDIPKGLTSPYVCLELSYNNLTNPLAQSLLLSCSMFPEDYEIDLEDLFRFGMRFDIIGTFGTMENARREMDAAIDMLKNCFLLMHAKEKQRVKMHDLVRDVALWIASKSGKAIFTGTEVDPRALADDESLKDKKAIAVWGLKSYDVLNYKINRPILETLLLSFNVSGGVKVSDGCLQSLENLKTLAILKSRWKSDALSLQESLKSLKNLRTLCLRGFDLGDISFVEILQALEILDLRDSYFDDLPIGIVELKKLRLLDLYECWMTKNENVEVYKVVGKCLQLEELYFRLSYNYKKDFPYDVSFSRLQRYVIEIGDNRRTLDDITKLMKKYGQPRSLIMNGFDVAPQSFISLPIKDLFIRAEFLCLRYQRNYKNIIPSMDPQGMNQLIALRLYHASGIECLVDNTEKDKTEVIAFSGLVYLSLVYNYSLREVFRDPSSRCSLKNLQELEIKNCGSLYSISFPRNSKLCNLKVISISDCYMLISLFTSSVVQTLELLEDLRISKCRSLRHIIEEENDVLSSTQSHSSLTLPKLRFLFIEYCDNLEYVFSVFLVQGLLSLESVDIMRNRALKYVFGNEKEHNVAGYPSFQQTNTITNLFNLNTLTFSDLPNLIAIWPEYFRAHLPSLNDLSCRYCPKLSIHKAMNASDIQQQTTPTENGILWLITNTLNRLEDDPLSHPQLKAVLKIIRLHLKDVRMKGIFQFQMGEEGGTTELLPLNLDINYLILENLPELNFIWKGPTSFLSLQNLHLIYVDGCPKLKTIFSTTVVTSLPMLKYLNIRNCDELEQIFDLGDAYQLNSPYSSQQVCFPTLSSITVQKCNKLKCLFYNLSACHFTSLRRLKIQECSQLHKAFAFSEEEEMGKDGEQVLLQKLKNIRLINLPNLEEIHQGFKLKEDVEQTLEECPKYSPSLYLHQDM